MPYSEERLLLPALTTCVEVTLLFGRRPSQASLHDFPLVPGKGTAGLDVGGVCSGVGPRHKCARFPVHHCVIVLAIRADAAVHNRTTCLRKRTGTCFCRSRIRELWACVSFTVYALVSVMVDVLAFRTLVTEIWKFLTQQS